MSWNPSRTRRRPATWTIGARTFTVLVAAVAAGHVAFAAGFTAAPADPVTTAQAVSLVDGNGWIHVLGGYTNGGAPMTTHEVFDPASGTWSSAAPLPVATRQACGATTVSGKLVVLGGTGASGYLADTQIYDPVTGTWHAGAPDPVIQGWGCAAARGRDGRIYVFGGEANRTTLEIYDPKTDTWTAGAALPHGRELHGASALRDGKIYVYGGMSGSSLSSMDVYDPASDSWTSGAAMPSPRNSFASATAYGRSIYVIGGSTSYGNGQAPYDSDSMVYDLASGTWSTGPTDTVGRREGTAVMEGTTLHVIGGTNGTPLGDHTTYEVQAKILFWHSYGSQAQASVQPLGSWTITDQTSATLPALSVLEGYDAIAVWTAGSFTAGTTTGDELADYVDHGGNVVEAFPSDQANFQVTGRFMSGGYACYTTPSSSMSSSGYTVDASSIVLPHSPLARGVTSAWVMYQSQGFSLNPACVDVMNATNGNLFAAVHRMAQGRIAFLDFYPYDSTEVKGDGWLIMANALRWALSGESPVVNLPPTASAGGPYTVNEGAALTLTATGTDPEGQPLTYAWDLTGNGSYTDATGATVAFPSTTTPGTFNVGVQVSDGQNTTTAKTTVTVTNLPPTITSLTAPNGTATKTLTFSATATDPGTDTPITFTWDFGDGSPAASGASVTHAYASAGTYTVTVTAADTSGGTSQKTAPVTISPDAPQVTGLTVPASADEGASVQMGMAVTYSGTDTVTYTWDFGDGTTGTGQTTTHTYGIPGTYTVTGTATNTAGKSTSQTASITITNLAPTLTGITGAGGPEGSPLSFSATATDPGTEPLTYTWDFGDGSAKVTGQSPTHTFWLPGTYTVTVTVDDGFGGTASGTKSVVITNVSPTIDSYVAPNGNEGQSLAFSVTAHDAGHDTLTATWLFGDGSSSVTGFQVTHTYMLPGTYKVTIVVGDGQTSTYAYTQVTIANLPPSISAMTAPGGNEGQSLTFGVTASDPGSDTLTYAWDFGDGGKATGAAPTHAFMLPGTYTVTVTVDDGNGGTVSKSAQVTIANLPPSISAITAPGGNEGQSLTFGVTASDPGSDTLTYTWDFGDGTAKATGPSPVHTYMLPGTYTVTVTVDDGNGGADTQSTQVTIANVAPRIASMTAPNGKEAEVLAFSAKGTDPGSDVLTYTWDFGDQTPAVKGAAATHAFMLPGTYTVTVTVDDGNGGTGRKTATVTIANVPPTLTQVTVPATVPEGTRFDVSATATDPGADKPSLSWSFGDGGQPLLGGSTQYIYFIPGTYTVTVTADDHQGGVVKATKQITVTNVPPQVAAMTAPDGNEGALLTFTGAGADAGHEPLTLTWDFGDGTATAVGTSVTHAYGLPGSYQVTLTVTDGFGGQDSLTKTVAIADVAPTLTQVSAPDGDEGSPVHLSATATDPGIGALTYTWDFGDGTPTADGAAVDHVFATAGTYPVTVTVADAQGETDSRTVQEAIANVPPTITEMTVPASTQVGTKIQLHGAATDPGSQNLTYAWNFGDGTPEVKGADATHTYAGHGTYTVMLSVSDGEGANVSKTETLEVQAVGPSLANPGPQTVAHGATLTVQLAASEADTNAKLTFSLVSGPGSVTAGGTYTYSPGASVADGDYPVVVKVTDDTGLSDQATFPVTVTGTAGSSDGGVTGGTDGGSGQNGSGSPKPTGCSCDATTEGNAGAPATGLVFLVLGALVTTRRRRRARASARR